MHSVRTIQYTCHKVSNFIMKLPRSIVRRGFFGTLKHTYHHFSYHAWLRFTRTGRQRKKDPDSFDGLFGFQTGGRENLLGLGVSSPNVVYGTRHEPTPPDLFLDVMRRLPIRHQEYAFVDLGAGKGRALLLAARLPWRKVTGVEFAPAFVRIARENIDRFGGPARKCQEIEILLMDAADFQLPPEKTVVYFFNPFEEPLMKRILNRIELSFRAHPTDIYLVYLNPVLNHLFHELSCFTLVDGADEWKIYRSVRSPSP